MAIDADAEYSLMNLLTVYLVKTFGKILAFVLPVFITLYLVVELVERIDEFVERQATLSVVMQYTLLRAPIIGAQVGPLAVLLSVALTIALLERNREMIAFLAAGASPLRLARPLLLGSLGIAAVTFCAEEYLLPGAHRGVMSLLERQTRPTPQSALVNQGEIWYRAPDAAFVHIELVEPAAQRIHGITIYRKGGTGDLVEQVEAAEGIWTGDHWTFLHGTISRFRTNVAADVDSFVHLDLAIGLEPADLRSMFTPPSHMSLSELRLYLRKLRGRGIDMLAYVIDFHTKLSAPLMDVVMTMVGLAAMWGARNARSISLGFAGTLCAAGGYWLLVTAGTALSRSQQLPLPLAIWLPHLVVLSLSTYVFWREADA